MVESKVQRYGEITWENAQVVRTSGQQRLRVTSDNGQSGVDTIRH